MSCSLDDYQLSAVDALLTNNTFGLFDEQGV